MTSERHSALDSQKYLVHDNKYPQSPNVVLFHSLTNHLWDTLCSISLANVSQLAWPTFSKAYSQDSSHFQQASNSSIASTTADNPVCPHRVQNLEMSQCRFTCLWLYCQLAYWHLTVSRHTDCGWVPSTCALLLLSWAGAGSLLNWANHIDFVVQLHLHYLDRPLPQDTIGRKSYISIQWFLYFTALYFNTTLNIGPLSSAPNSDFAYYMYCTFILLPSAVQDHTMSWIFKVTYGWSQNRDHCMYCISEPLAKDYRSQKHIFMADRPFLLPLQ